MTCYCTSEVPTSNLVTFFAEKYIASTERQMSSQSVVCAKDLNGDFIAFLRAYQHFVRC